MSGATWLDPSDWSVRMCLACCKNEAWTGIWYFPGSAPLDRAAVHIL